MALAILSNSGKINYNIKELIADKFSDLPVEGLAAGSTAYIVDEETSYMFNTLGQWVETDIGTGGSDKLKIVPLTEDEIDPTTGEPTILGAKSGIIYLAPNTKPGSSDLYIEWINVNGNWEKFGSAAIDLENLVVGNSISVGLNNTASGTCSAAFGYGTIASGYHQVATGIANIEGDNLTLFVVGNGTFDDESKEYVRSNAYTLDHFGNGWFSGDVYVRSTSGTNKDEGSKKLATEEYVNNLINSIPNAEDNRF